MNVNFVFIWQISALTHLRTKLRQFPQTCLLLQQFKCHKMKNNPAAAMSLSNRVAFKNYEVIHLSWYCSSARNTQHAVQINEKHNLAVVVVCLLHRSVPVVFYLPAPNFESVPSWKKRKLAAEVSSTCSLLTRCFSCSTMSLWNDISSQKSAQKISEQDRIQIFLKVNSFQLC